MQYHHIDIVTDAIINEVSSAIRKNSDEIMNAYERLHEEGGLQISCAIKMQGNLEQIKMVINLSFPRESYKRTIEFT